MLLSGRMLAGVVVLAMMGAAALSSRLLGATHKSATTHEQALFGVWERGAALLDRSPEEVRAKHGNRVVHQSWKSSEISSGLMARCFASWSQMHPEALHVLWTDADNDLLVRQHYPQYAKLYESLRMPIMKADMVRLLYLHRYGGLYVDMDFEAKSDVFAALPPLSPGGSTLADVYVGESPVLLLGVTENSLMVATTLSHPFWLACVDTIASIVGLIESPDMCSRYKWSGCAALIPLFHGRLTRKLMLLTHLLDISGPNVLAKTMLSHLEDNWSVRLLPRGRFHVQETVTVHHQMNSWMGAVYSMWEIAVACLFVAVLLMAAGALLAWRAMHSSWFARGHANSAPLTLSRALVKRAGSL